MYKSQIKFQRIICFALLATAALVFIYSLCLLTDVFETTNLAHGLFPDYGIEIENIDLYLVMQDYNRMVTILGLVLIVCVVFVFAFNTHSRRKYYFSNYLFTGVVCAANIYTAYYLFVNINYYKPIYLSIDFEDEMVKYVAETLKLNLTKSTFWFDFGYIVCGILILVSVLAIFNLVWKTMLMKEEAHIIKEGLEA